MGTINILLQDNKNRLCQKMCFLRDETESLIYDNINTINRIELNLALSSIDINFSTSDLEKQGWKVDEGLYDKLIIEYNNRSDKEKLLTRWK